MTNDQPSFSPSEETRRADPLETLQAIQRRLGVGAAEAMRIQADPIDWINRVVQDVAELPDRTSPDDWPEAMLVTADELRAVLQSNSRAEVAELRATLEERTRERDAANVQAADARRFHQSALERADRLRERFAGVCRAETEAFNRAEAAEAALKETQGCDGNCSCAVWHSRHEAAMALYDTMDKLRAAEATLTAARASALTEAVEAIESIVGVDTDTLIAARQAVCALLEAALGSSPAADRKEGQ